MENKIRCQSCGMPLSKGFFGRHADGTETEEFCKLCYADGAFTNPDQTLDEMIASSIENMRGDLQMPIEQARDLANSFIPKLNRWRKD